MYENAVSASKSAPKSYGTSASAKIVLCCMAVGDWGDWEFVAQERESLCMAVLA